MAPTASIHKKSRIARWYGKVAAFKVEDLFSKKKEPGPKRTIFVNQNLPNDYYDARGRIKPECIYSTNQVITSKYTVVTFLPRNLLEQFRRIANIFFLFIDILQFFPKFSTISPGLVIVPLLIVLLITALKDGYEDIKRHQSDRRVNNSLVRVLAGGGFVNPNVMQKKSKTFVKGAMRSYQLGSKILNKSSSKVESATSTSQPPYWKETAWEDVAVGDFVKILENESIPADVLICSTSEEENVAFVETKNLDGETNLKSRNAIPALSHLRSAEDCTSSSNTFQIEADRPDTNMYKLHAAVRVGDQLSPVDMQMALLRGTVLRNTKWVIGLVLYSGEDSRIVMNSGGTPSKRSRVERQMNPQVFLNLLILVLVALACGIAEAIMERSYSQQSAPWLYDSGSPAVNGVITFFFALITFQNIIPISLYISIEFVRTCQAAFIYFDPNITHKDQPTLARSWNLSDDLGQIEYVISDKTGTLTQNHMVFRQCSIGGKVYEGGVSDEQTENGQAMMETILPTDEKKDSEDIAFVETVSGSSTSGRQRSSPDQNIQTKDDIPNVKPDALSSPEPVSTAQARPKVNHHFHDEELTRDLETAVQPDLDPATAAHARNLNGFFTVLAMCHTVLTAVDPETGMLEYKAQSPDEAALVQAAADMGFVFRGREKEILYLQTPFGTQAMENPEHREGTPALPDSTGGIPFGSGNGLQVGSAESIAAGRLYEQGTVEKYELLNILEFTSVRKRMSIILRKLDSEDGRLFLLSKGADNVIFERLKEGVNEEMKDVTERHLAEFAGQGLRTLTLAYKVIGEEEYQSWNERYIEASVALDNRDEKIETVSDEIEHDLRLLGATAIEDRLQDGVPETIADLKAAGIKVWVATGDKLETAIAIGHSTNLITPESNIIVIRGGNHGKPVYNQILNSIEEFFPDVDLLNDEHQEDGPSFVEEDGQGQYSGGGPLQRVNTGISSIVGPDNGDRPGGFVLVIDGAGLSEVLEHDERKTLLLKLAMMCEGVICCRVSPLQKALMVNLIKDGTQAMTLAIGDGANDVSMIQAADVGVGISGEEGMQAVNSSDYAIAQFRFLKRLLFVHGHWSYARNGVMILNFFYKNIVSIGVLFWFQIYCGWSSTFVFEYTYLLFWNSFWTIAPVIGIGVFDRFADDHVLMSVPQLFWIGREGKWFGIGQFIAYMLDGVLQSAIIYFIIMYTYMTNTARSDGWGIGLYEFSTIMVFSAVWTANLYNGLNTTAWTAWVFFAVFIGGILLWLYTIVYNSISPGWFVTPVWGNNVFMFTSAYFWLCLPITVLLSLLPRYIYKAYRFGFNPDDIDIFRYINKTQPNLDIAAYAKTGNPLAALKSHRPASLSSRRESTIGSVASLPRPLTDFRSASRTDMSTGIRTVHRGFDFSIEENGVSMRRMQTNLSERRLSSRNLTGSPETGRPDTGSVRRKGERFANVLTASRNFLRKKPSDSKEAETHP